MAEQSGLHSPNVALVSAVKNVRIYNVSKLSKGSVSFQSLLSSLFSVSYDRQLLRCLLVINLHI